MSEQEALEYLMRGHTENMLLEMVVRQVLAAAKESVGYPRIIEVSGWIPRRFA